MVGLLADAGYSIGVVGAVLAELLVLSSLEIAAIGRLAKRLSSLLLLVFAFWELVAPSIVSSDVDKIVQTLPR